MLSSAAAAPFLPFFFFVNPATSVLVRGLTRFLLNSLHNICVPSELVTPHIRLCISYMHVFTKVAIETGEAFSKKWVGKAKY